MRKVNLALFVVLCLLVGTVFVSADTTKAPEPVKGEILELEMPKIVDRGILAYVDNDVKDDIEEMEDDSAEVVEDDTDDSEEPDDNLTVEQMCKHNEKNEDADEWYHIESEDCIGHIWEEADTFKFCTRCGHTVDIERDPQDEDVVEIIIESSDEDIEIDLGEVDNYEDDTVIVEVIDESVDELVEE